MIEDNIKVLRQAAKISSTDNTHKDEKVWCIIAGNVELIDDIAYRAIASKHSVRILFREHAILKENKLRKKFDFIMLHGNSLKINEFKRISDEKGGSFIRISPMHLKEEPNLMILVAPDDAIRRTVSTIERSKIPFAILLESQTTGFIEVDLDPNVKLPGFIKSMLKPLYNVSDVVLSTILISVDEKKDIGKVQSVATSNKVFVIDFKDLKMEASQ